MRYSTVVEGQWLAGVQYRGTWPLDLLGKPHAAEQIIEARIGSQSVEWRPDFEQRQPRIAVGISREICGATSRCTVVRFDRATAKRYRIVPGSRTGIETALAAAK
jgi:hypothetical protein